MNSNKLKKVYISCSNITNLLKKIKNKESIIGIEYNLFNPNGYETFHSIYDLNVDDVVAIYKDTDETKSPYEWMKWNGITLIKSL
jgi:hypothetical protein